MNKFFFVPFMLLLLVGCQPANIKRKIADKVENKCKGMQSCTTIINIQEVTDFKWDKLYLFELGTSLEDVNKALGFDYPYFEDVDSRIVFVLNNRVVYHEDEFPDPETKATGGIIFKHEDGALFHCYRFNKAVFKVEKSFVNGYKYYELSPFFDKGE